MFSKWSWVLPRKLNELNKVLITTLHLKNAPLSGYIDDFFTKRDIFLNM